MSSGRNKDEVMYWSQFYHPPPDTDLSKRVDEIEKAVKLLFRQMKEMRRELDELPDVVEDLGRFE